MCDSSEHALYLINEEIKTLLARQEDHSSGASNILYTQLIPLLASVRDYELLLDIFTSFKPDTVFHVAAYKHVPLVEENPIEGIRNNTYGTLNCAQAALKNGSSNFILISTDKAVRPTNVMGASKRLAELIIQAIDEIVKLDGRSTTFSIVRFGNVLGSSGSVAPLFAEQIKVGGPITLTHPDITRYFMTISEAAQLVIQSCAMASGGDVFVLDMGEPVRIYDLALNMIYLSGLIVKDEMNPLGDIEIKVTGLRPGEKLYEELLIGDNPQPTGHPKIMKANDPYLPWAELEIELGELSRALDGKDGQIILAILKKLVPSYQPSIEIQKIQAN